MEIVRMLPSCSLTIFLYVARDIAEDEHIEFYGIVERQELSNDI